MFGGHGSAQMKRISRELQDVQLIMMCGRSDALAASLRAQSVAAPRAIVGFTGEVDRYMPLGDFFIGKPGPGCISEAVHMGLPVLTFDNAWTMPQERYNTRWIRENGVGKVLRSVATLRVAAGELIAELPQYRARVRAIENRAVFEVPDMLATILKRAAQPAAAPAHGAIALAH